MATKRRRVWVTFKGEKQKEPAALNATAADAADISKWYGTRAVPMVERLPGDVVLSRENVALLKATIKQLEKIAQEHLGQRAPVSVLALLRGRR